MKHSSKLFSLCLYAVMGPFLLLNVPLLAQLPGSDKQAAITEAKKQVAKVKKDYRIEVEKDKEEQSVKVKFMSPDGKTIKTMSPDETVIAESGKSLIHKSGYRESPDYDYAEYERKLLNARGEVKWQKSWKNYPENGVDPEGGFSGWFEGISDNGERSYVTYRSTDGVYNLLVLGENGEEITKVSYPEMLSGLEISPDGKIVGAETYLLLGDRRLKHLFFLEVDTGRTKVVKAESDTGYAYGGVHASVRIKEGYKPLPGYVTIYWNYKSGGIAQVKKVAFNSLPNDLSELFPKGGEEK